jgi:hypothetical protein
MKPCAYLTGAVVLLAVHCGLGQGIEVSLKLATGVYIVGEPIKAELQVENRLTGDFCTRAPLGEDRLLLEVSNSPHDQLTPLQDDPNIEPLTLIGGDTWKGMAAIEQRFPLRTPGRYFVVLVAIQNDRRYTSVRRSFDVVPGLELKSALQLFAKGDVRSRRFALVYWAREQQEILFLRMEDDPATRTWETIRLGPLLRTSDPRIDIAPDGTVTVMHRATQDAYLKTIIRSQPGSVEVTSQEQLLDPAASVRQHMQPFQKMAVERQQEANREKKGSWWWPFGKSSDAGKNGD